MVPVPGPPGTYEPAGTLTLDFVFKNTRGNKKKFTPRQLTRIAFESVPLLCFNAPVNPTGSSEFLLTTTLETKIQVEKVPIPPGRIRARQIRLQVRLQLPRLHRHDQWHD